MKEIIVALMQQMSVIGILAFVVGRTPAFVRAVEQRLTFKDKVYLAVFFGAMCIVGTYTGVWIYGAIANTRAIGCITAGLLGGPWVGLTAGLIGGLHRWWVGGFTGFACGLSTTLEGLLGGLVHTFVLKGAVPSGKTGFAVGVLGELMQMAILLLVARPFSLALQLVKVIILPMTLTNALGIALFLSILKNTQAESQRIQAIQAKKALDIANRTLPYMRNGFNPESAEAAARIILEVSEVHAVAITDTHKVLAYVGIGSDHHRQGEPVLTEGTHQALRDGSIAVLNGPREIGCPFPGCPLKSGVVVPLVAHDRVIGTLKLYQLSPQVSPVVVELARGVAQLLSYQIELAELNERSRLLSQAELKVLHAQINPHFLFNALNTVVSFCRRDPEKAADLLVQLSDYFRKNLRNCGRLVELAEEIEHISAYLTIQQARYGQRLKVEYDIHPDTLHLKVPALILQPLVENCLKHGLDPKPEGGTIRIRTRREGSFWLIEVEDDGVGISQETASLVLSGNYRPASNSGVGIGLSNVHGRLKVIYPGHPGLSIQRLPAGGTRVSFPIPMSGQYELLEAV